MKYITTPIYYVNDKPHIGHAYTTLVADIVARTHVLSGEEVFFLAGTDEHGTKIAQAAEKAGKQPQEFTDEIAASFKEAWQNLGIDYNYFIRTTDTDHEKTVQAFLSKLKENKALYEGEYEGLYCNGCETFLHEKDLVDGKCADHNKEPEGVKEKNWFFKLSEYVDQVKEKIKTDEIIIRPEKFKKEVLSALEQGVPDFSVSRPNVEWGIPLPWDSKQTMYVWVDALINYFSATGWENDLEGPKWPADVHVVGKDIIKFHAIYWPALLLAAGFDIPKSILVNGFFTIDGQKMSKSLGNVIDPNELVDAYGVDGARYLIVSQFPFGQDGDIAQSKFDEKYNADLANGIGNLVQRVSTLIEKFELEKSLEINEEKGDFVSEIWQHFNVFEIFEGITKIQKKIQDTDELLAKEKPWEKEKAEDVKDILQTSAQNIYEIGKALQPIIPETATQILKRFTKGEIIKGEGLFPRK
ncbi:MAG: methionine--tRNA ligase [Candidatus Jacksonbacteria bacterium]|mgnify:FL=1|jgi:methionyl-tRNA synthetase|nr:methionine--tRNA ligase [Candidatus Jacksonbacteria bacterium]MBT6301319.1 methionine--tRNA ligase [Candidatus Jacksonbacteria bacterium]